MPSYHFATPREAAALPPRDALSHLAMPSALPPRAATPTSRRRLASHLAAALRACGTTKGGGGGRSFEIRAASAEMRLFGVTISPEAAEAAEPEERQQVEVKVEPEKKKRVLIWVHIPAKQKLLQSSRKRRAPEKKKGTSFSPRVS